MFWVRRRRKKNHQAGNDKCLVAERGLDPELANLLKAVVRKNAKRETAFNIRVELSSDTTLFTQAEIQEKIGALSQSDSTVFFYMARGPTRGDSLHSGAAFIELNPCCPGKEQKKYNVYAVDVIDIQPVQGALDFDKPRDIAVWTEDARDRGMYYWG